MVLKGFQGYLKEVQQVCQESFECVSKKFKKRFKEVSRVFQDSFRGCFNPTSHGVSDSVAPMGGGPERTPHKKSRKESFLTPCCYIAFGTWYIKGSHKKNQPSLILKN